MRHGDRKGALYAIENGRIRPSKLLIDSVAGLLQGKPEFVLIDDQKVAHESILEGRRARHRRSRSSSFKAGRGRASR